MNPDTCFQKRVDFPLTKMDMREVVTQDIINLIRWEETLVELRKNGGKTIQVYQKLFLY